MLVYIWIIFGGMKMYLIVACCIEHYICLLFHAILFLPQTQLQYESNKFCSTAVLLVFTKSVNGNYCVMNQHKNQSKNSTKQMFPIKFKSLRSFRFRFFLFFGFCTIIFTYSLIDVESKRAACVLYVFFFFVENKHSKCNEIYKSLSSYW